MSGRGGPPSAATTGRGVASLFTAAVALGALHLPAAAGSQPATDAGDPGFAVDQRFAARTPAPIPGGDRPRVFLMTLGRGDAVWERYAHNAILLHDPAAGPPVAYNWGEFDFAQPNFIGRFLTGDTKYAMRAIDAQAMVEIYARRYNRAIWLQELALTSAQITALAAALRANDTEAARYYRYDYYNDNCSTRVRDALDRALGGALRAQLGGRPAGVTWRSDTRRLNAGDAAVYTGIQLALGRPADRQLDRWESAYLPLDLRASVRGVRVADGAGRPAPLVRAEYELWGAPGREPEPTALPSYAAGYAAGGAAAAALLGVAGWTARAGGGAGRLLLGALGTGWSLAVGLLGTALLLAGTVTKHASYMGRNWNLLGVNPLALLLAGLTVAAVVGRRGPGASRRARRAARAAALVALLAAVGAACALLPGAAGQRSAELFLLLVPAHAALWWALRQLSRADAEPRTADPAPAAG